MRLSLSQGTIRALGATAVAAGCAGQAKVSAGGEAPPPLAVEVDTRSQCETEGKRVVQLDLNKDEAPDVFKLFASKQDNGQAVEFLACKEVDLNFDGKKDVWFHYNEAGERTKEEMDLDFDGRIDLVTYRQGDKVLRQELDTNFDGASDIFRHFEEGKLARVDRDSTGDGNVDYWEYYEGGVLDRVGYDVNGDGKIDKWERAAPPEAPGSAPGAPAGAPAAETAKV